MDFLDGFIFINILEQIADFRFIIPLNSKIQTGTSASVDINPNSMGTLDITFDKAFSKTPSIVCSIKSGTNNYKYGSVVAFVDFNTVTKTGFTIKVANASESLVSPNVTWIACEQ